MYGRRPSRFLEDHNVKQTFLTDIQTIYLRMVKLPVILNTIRNKLHFWTGLPDMIAVWKSC